MAPNAASGRFDVRTYITAPPAKSFSMNAKYTVRGISSRTPVYFASLHDADDLDRRLRPGVRAEADVPADRAAIAEVLLRVALVDDGHLERGQGVRIRFRVHVPRVAIVEVAAGDQRNAASS